MITILQSDFRNSRLLSQFGNDKFEKRLNYDQIWYTGVFEVGDHDLALIHLFGRAASAVFTGAAAAPNLASPFSPDSLSSSATLLCNVPEIVWVELGSGATGREMTLSESKIQIRFIKASTYEYVDSA